MNSGTAGFLGAFFAAGGAAFIGLTAVTTGAAFTGATGVVLRGGALLRGFVGLALPAFGGGANFWVPRELLDRGLALPAFGRGANLGARCAGFGAALTRFFDAGAAFGETTALLGFAEVVRLGVAEPVLWGAAERGAVFASAAGFRAGLTEAFVEGATALPGKVFFRAGAGARALSTTAFFLGACALLDFIKVVRTGVYH